MSFKKFIDFDLVFGRDTKRQSYDELLNAESSIGRTLFGPIPAGHQREFFAMRRNTWMWYENWFDKAGKVQEVTLRYEVRPDGVYKKPLGGVYAKIEGSELENFVAAVREYARRIKSELYS